MSGLSAIGEAAFDMLIPSYGNVLNELEARTDAWDEAERKPLKKDQSKQEDDEEIEMGRSDQSLQNVDWPTARLVTPVTGHRLQLGEV